ncbi:MAG: transposase family protein, partial [Bacteroidales bacterium]
KKSERTFVKYRKIMNQRSFEVLEMDIKFVWVEEYKRHAYIITVIDTFTRFCLNWKVTYQIRQEQVKQLWSEIIERYLQTYNCLQEKVRIEIRNDNDSRFLAKKI